METKTVNFVIRSLREPIEGVYKEMQRTRIKFKNVDNTVLTTGYRMRINQVILDPITGELRPVVANNSRTTTQMCLPGDIVVMTASRRMGREPTRVYMYTLGDGKNRDDSYLSTFARENDQNLPILMDHIPADAVNFVSIGYINVLRNASGRGDNERLVVALPDWVKTFLESVEDEVGKNYKNAGLPSEKWGGVTYFEFVKFDRLWKFCKRFGVPKDYINSMMRTKKHLLNLTPVEANRASTVRELVANNISDPEALGQTAKYYLTGNEQSAVVLPRDEVKKDDKYLVVVNDIDRGYCYVAVLSIKN